MKFKAWSGLLFVVFASSTVPAHASAGKCQKGLETLLTFKKNSYVGMDDLDKVTFCRSYIDDLKTRIPVTPGECKGLKVEKTEGEFRRMLLVQIEMYRESDTPKAGDSEPYTGLVVDVFEMAKKKMIEGLSAKCEARVRYEQSQQSKVGGSSPAPADPGKKAGSAL